MKKFLFLPLTLSMSLSLWASESNYKEREETRAQNQYFFDSSFLKGGGEKNIDLSRFSKASGLLPGVYPSDIYLNDMPQGVDSIRLAENGEEVKPCLTKENIRLISFKLRNLPADFYKSIDDEKGCIEIEKLLPNSSANFDSGLQRLTYSIPQLYINEDARGYVNPALWDHGVSGVFIGYDLNAYKSNLLGDSVYAMVNSGVNIGSWYFRHNGNYSWLKDNGSNYQSINTYVQKDINSIQGRIILGQNNTRGLIFDTLPFEGVEVYSVDQMLPESRRGYAPDIRGIAKTNARVLVKQNGRLIYEKNVAPGAFEITDLYPTGYGGNLDVTVLEADGEEQKFQVAYSALNELLRVDAHKYSLVAGRLRDSNLGDPALYQFTYQRGLLNWLTGNAGFQAGKDYLAGKLGVAIGGDWGIVSLAVTSAQTKLYNKKLHGESYDIAYSKYIDSTKTNLTLAAYRYATSNFLDYRTAHQLIRSENGYSHLGDIKKTKNRLAFSLSQSLPNGWGNIYASGFKQNYWGSSDSDLQYQLGYNNNYKSVFYSLSIGKVYNRLGNSDTNVNLNLSMPLGGIGDNNRPYLTSSFSHARSGRAGGQLGISGVAGENNEFSYNATSTYYNQGEKGSLALNAGYRSPFVNLTLAHSIGENYNNTSFGASGSIIAVADGFVYSPYQGETFAMIEAPGAQGAKVKNFPGVQLDSNGRAAVPYLIPYSINSISIDPKNISRDLELDSTTEAVAPYEGAIIKINYNTKVGYQIVATVTGKNKEMPPFGAPVFDDTGLLVGYIVQNGQIYARVEKEQGNLIVEWEKDAVISRCNMPYKFNLDQDRDAHSGMIKLDLNCTN